MPWEQRTISTELPDAFDTLQQSTENASNSIQALADALKAAIDAAKVFVSSTTDPFASLAQQLIDEVETLIDDLFGSGFFFLPIVPSNVSTPLFDTGGVGRLTPDQVVQEAVNSFDDEGDANRPQLSDSATVAAFGILVTAISRTEILTTLQNLAEIIQSTDIDEYIEELTRGIEAERESWKPKTRYNTGVEVVPTNPNGFVYVATQTGTSGSTEPDWPITIGDTVTDGGEEGNDPIVWRNAGVDPGDPDAVPQVPNWRSITVQDIPQMTPLYAILKKYLSLFRGYLNTGDDNLNNFLDAIDRKVQSITDALDELDEAITTATAGVGATGVYVFTVEEGTGGVNRIKDELSDHNFSGLTDNRYSAMMLFVAGGANASGLDTFRSLFTS